MSQVATNSYIHKHQVDSRKGVTTLKNEELKEQIALNREDHWVDTMSNASSTRKSSPFIQSSRVPLPLPKKSKGGAKRSYYTELALAFGKVFTAMGEGVQTETAIFAEQQQENTTNAMCVLEGQSNSIKEQNKIDDERHKSEEEEKHAAKYGKIMQWVNVGITAAVILSVVVVAAAPALTAASAATEASLEAGATTTEATTESVQIDAFSSTESTEGETAATTTEGAAQATESTAETSTEAAQEESFTSQFLRGLGRHTLSAVGGAIMGSPSLVNYIESQRTAKAEELVAKMQKEAGVSLGKVALMQAGFKTSQKQTQQSSSVIQNLTSQLSDVISTYSDMMQSVRAATSSFAQAI